MSAEHERILLGALFLEPQLIGREDIDASLFDDPRHRVVLEAIRELHEAGQPVDLLTVQDALKGRINEAGGLSYLSGLTNVTPSSANASYYIGQLREAARLRALKQLKLQLDDGLRNSEGSDKLIEFIEGEIIQIRMNANTLRSTGPRNGIQAVIEKAERRMQANVEGPSGVPTGFSKLDMLTGGFQPADLVLVAARTSVGKTSLVLSFIEWQIRQGIGVGLASLETSAIQVWERLLAMRSLVPTGRLRFGHLENDDFRALVSAANELYDCPFWILDRPDLGIYGLRSWTFAEVEKGAQIVYVDYAGLLSGGNVRAPRWERMADVSKGLKNIARELGIPVVVLVQLNRGAADTPEPELHNIRDSGAFEQDADLVLLIQRSGKQELNDIVPARLRIAKHRNGPTGFVDLVFKRSLAQFLEAVG